MIYTHALDPVALAVGSFQLHWYGIMYFVSFLSGYAYLRAASRRGLTPLTASQVDTLVFAVMLGVLLGGRLGYFVFYHPAQLLADPLSFFTVWQGGMSFHGGLLGVLLAVAAVARRWRLAFLHLTDLLTIPTALGLALGRVGNFINAELVGRPTDGTWGVVFPAVDQLPRHPSQLYSSSQNLLITLVLGFLLLRPKKLPTGTLSFVFLFLVGIGRYIVEQLWRVPADGYWGSLTLGQVYSVPLILIGLVGLIWVLRR
jgi:phosphatidylglycerol:prolipoprotein diacylglycerol transferase